MDRLAQVCPVVPSPRMTPDFHMILIKFHGFKRTARFQCSFAWPLHCSLHYGADAHHGTVSAEDTGSTHIALYVYRLEAMHAERDQPVSSLCFAPTHVTQGTHMLQHARLHVYATAFATLLPHLTMLALSTVP